MRGSKPPAHLEGGQIFTVDAGYPGVGVLKAAGYTVTTGQEGAPHGRAVSKTGEAKSAPR
ncbi:hypothetical protein FRUB_05081 [Fimbriiglobus ruber]|uniref:Uncharacterized protein n=1 Tax=Fimbriiglobus ruber TaxID=1908690 RepID=A0A225DFA5_9BACT|nr:hypothetical protein FRUB_05081 [Fimbriiglobus ruber]